MFYTAQERLTSFGDYSFLSELCGEVLPTTLALFFVLFISYMLTGWMLNSANKKLLKLSKSKKRFLTVNCT